MGDGSGIDYRILGSLEVICDGCPLELKPAKARALLALLLLDPGRPISTDRLIDQLWGETPPTSAAVSLRVLISRLRETLAAAGMPDAIVTRPPGYALAADRADVDAHRFETLLARGASELAGGDSLAAATTLRDALALWRGPALADLPDVPALAAEAARLEEARLLGLEQRITADLACGRHDTLVAELESLVRAHPLRERLWGARMLALYRCGRQADALAAFTELRDRLVGELGIEPSRELRELQAAILEQNPKLTVATTRATHPASPAESPLPSGVVTFLLTDIEGSSGLWERDSKRMAMALEQHDELVADAVARTGGVLVKDRGEGDSTFSVFARASDAIAAAHQLRSTLETAAWPAGVELRVRLAVHTGEAQERDGDYLGPTVNRAARLRSIAKPGQVMLSQTTAELVGDALPEGTLLVDLGRRGLRGHERDEQVFELVPAQGAEMRGVETFRRELPRELTAATDAVFVGRKPELEHLDGLWREVLTGARRVAFVAGEPGIGKTRLAAEVASVAHDDGAVVLFGRCDEDLGVAYQPFAQALRDYVAACPSTELAAHAARGAADLARLVPELGDRLLGARPTGTGAPEDERERLFDAVVALFAAASQVRPLVLVLDDLQWAAKPTLLMLRHMLRSMVPMRLLVIGTYRDTELDRSHPLAEILADLRRTRAQRARIRLRGLDADAVSAYVEASGGQGLEPGEFELTRMLYESTEGNPFFIGEVLRHLVESGLVRRDERGLVSAAEIAEIGLPEGVKDVITRRLSHLSEAANRALAVASVIGPTFSLALLERVPEAADDPDRLIDALDEALRAGLLDETAPGAYTFSHALIRQTLYSELTATRRARLHRRVGEALEQLPDREDKVEALARHFSEAALDGQISKAADYALAAGRHSLTRLAHEEAVSQLEHGLELLALESTPDHARRAELQLALAQAHRELGALERNREASLEAAAEARADGSAERLARAALVVWSRGGTGIRDATIPELAEEALAALGTAEPALRARLLARLTHYRAVAEGRGFLLLDQAEQAVALARESRDHDALTAALGANIRLLYATGRVADRVVLCNELISRGLQTGDRRAVMTGLALRHDAHLELADRHAYDDDLAELEALATEHPTRLGKNLTAVTGALRALLEGRFDEAASLSHLTLTLGGPRAEVLSAHPMRITTIRREQGRHDEALAQGSELLGRTGGHAFARTRIALLQAEAGDHDTAKTTLHELTDDNLAAMPRDQVFPVALSDLAEVCARLNDAKRAAPLYAQLVPHAGHLLTGGGYICYGSADRFLGMLATLLGRYEDAETHYQTAIKVEDAMKARPLSSRTRYWYARMLLARDTPPDREKVLKVLDTALAISAELGMATLHAETRTLIATAHS